jgi:hypothetical protein
MDTWMRHQGTEHLVVAMKSGESGWSEGGGCREAKSVGPTSDGRSLKDKAKPYCILRREIWEAYLKVKSTRVLQESMNRGLKILKRISKETST